MKNVILIATSLIVFNVEASSFNIELTNINTKVSSPQKLTDPVSIIVKNSTNVKVFAEIRSSEKVLSRFVVDGGDSKTLQTKLPSNKKLYYVSVSPPAQAVELKFNQRDYAVPEEK